jgi:hypothetical protein
MPAGQEISLRSHATTLSLTPLMNGRSIPTWSAAAGLDHEPDSFDLSHASVLSLPKKLIGESHLIRKIHISQPSAIAKAFLS